MDKASILGITVGATAIVGGNALEGGHLASLFQPTAALIVVGGTLGACLVSYPLDTVVDAVRSLRSVFAPPPDPGVAGLVDEIGGYALKARREGIVALERVLGRASHPFLARALAMAVDGVDSRAMRENLEMMLDHADEHGETSARVWEAAGGYSPTMGIIGAVMGLIHVMQNLADVSSIGAGIAVAFVATIYGVALANLVYLPAAAKLKLRHREQMARLSLMMEGALAIQEGQNPAFVKEKLVALSPAPRADPGVAAPPDARASEVPT